MKSYSPSDDGFEVYRRQLMQAASPTPLAKRQGLGGGAGGNDEVTTATGVQTISGYDPPPSSQIPDPTVSSGKIISTGDIPGFNSSSGGSSAGGSSPADAVRQPAHVIIAAVGGVAAGAAYILF